MDISYQGYNRTTIEKREKSVREESGHSPHLSTDGGTTSGKVMASGD